MSMIILSIQLLKLSVLTGQKHPYRCLHLDPDPGRLKRSSSMVGRSSERAYRWRQRPGATPGPNNTREVTMWKEIGRTVRTAIRGWGPTARLVILLAAATAAW